MSRLNQHDRNPKTVTVVDLLLVRLSKMSPLVEIGSALGIDPQIVVLDRKGNETIYKRINTLFTVRFLWFGFPWTFCSMIVLGQLGQEDATI